MSRLGAHQVETRNGHTHPTGEIAEPEAIMATLMASADLVAAELDADVLIYLGPIARPFERDVLGFARRPQHRNVALVLTTDGGDAHAAYLIARFLQSKYERFTLFIPDRCKSAGTLVALGAHVIVMSDHGELGPLDVQVLKRDELGETSSSLVAIEALSTLEKKSFSMFERFLLEIKDRSGGLISLRTAAQIAAQVTAGLFGHVYQQVDPERLGGIGRAMRIAEHYGMRLAIHSRNTDEDRVRLLVAGYPSHAFVIDRLEARSLFNNVREPTRNETALLDLVETLEVPEEEPIVVQLSPATGIEGEEDSCGINGIGEGAPTGEQETRPASGDSRGEPRSRLEGKGSTQPASSS